MKEAFRNARRAAVPLVGIETVDPALSIAGVMSTLNGQADKVPIMSWDICRGLQGLNALGVSAIEWYDPAAMQLPEILGQLAGRMKGGNRPARAILFLHQCHRFWERDGVTQGLFWLRDGWKESGSTAVLLAPSIQLPAELVQDVVVLSEPLPDVASLERTVEDTVKAAREAGATIPEEYGKGKIVDTLLGLSGFAAEQALAMSLRRDGIDADGLWERKRRLVEQTPGLSVWRGQETFECLGGLSNLKTFLKAVLGSGRTPVRCIGFIDEIEKALAGAAGDLSGVSQDQLGVVLRVMQDYEIPGIILVGPPGTGKSAIAKAAGGVCGGEVLSIDFGAMTGSLVGESQAKMRAAMETFRAVSQGKGLFIATCNKLASLPPELRRRFTLGTFYVDLPNAEERAVIWKIWIKRYFPNDEAQDISRTDRPNDEGWTGAEIKACCEVSFRTGLSLKEAAGFIVPVSKSAADAIDALRKQANGKFISANTPGVYDMNKALAAEPAGEGFRKLNFN